MSQNNIRYWFVGAMWGKEDLSLKFIEESIWTNGYSDKYIEQVNSIKVGDLIAIKSSYTRKNSLPFNNPKGKMASAMRIKAIGKVTGNNLDGQHIQVDWTVVKNKVWYFFTGRSTVWEVKPNRWLSKALIDFTFNDKDQDYDKFRNASFWKDRFGDNQSVVDHFSWIPFYEEFADKLLEYKSDRKPLLDEIIKMSTEFDSFTSMYDLNEKDEKVLLKDICPFTIFGIFNRGIKDENRVAIARRFASFLEMKSPIPTDFDGIPVLNNMKSWLFPWEKDRGSKDIDNLWNLLEKALELDKDYDNNIEDFYEAYNNAIAVANSNWNITMALFWIRPNTFITLDTRSRNYIENELKVEIKKQRTYRVCTSSNYIDLALLFEDKFKEEDFSIHSFPELSFKSWTSSSAKNSVDKELDHNKLKIELSPINTILYGPPGTGKTYNTIRRAVQYANPEFEYRNDFDCLDDLTSTQRSLLKEEYERLVEAGNISFTTFHQSLSYEDFIEGIKPTVDDDKVIYEIKDGIFKDISLAAEKNWLISQNSEDLTFYQVWENFVEPFKDEDSEEVKLTIKTQRGQFIIYGIDDKTIRFEKASGSRTHTLCIKSLHNYYLKPELIQDLGGLRTYYQSLVKHLKAIKGITKSHKEELKQFVLVIDEINRGNVASIFGELITLLEPDKRLGMPEELSVILPYSKEKYSVPPNLHIIGTMNTADRSVEALDVALRRRFSFEEMMPKPELLLGEDFNKFYIDLNMMLVAINSRIVRLKDRDHSIGHSYFYTLLGCKEDLDVKEELVHIFRNKIIPLLEEYFYGDWEKIGMILGGTFVRKDNTRISFAPGFGETSDYSEIVYSIAESTKWDFESIYVKESN